jgi:type I restriction enzyme S subunit
MNTGWQATTLGEAYDVRDGTHDSPKYHATGYPLITSKNLKQDGINFDDIKLISEDDYRKINARSLVHKGDVLFAMIGTIGNPTVVTSEPNFAIKNIALFKLNSTHSSNFLKYYLESQIVISKMIAEAKGTTQKFVGLGYLRGFPINLPSLSEQQRIVAILDEAFAGIATAAANAKKNLNNARELFDSEVQAILTKRGDGWADKTLDQVCIVERGSSPRPIKEFFTTAPDGVNWIKIGDTEEGGKYVYSTAQKITLEGAKQSRFVKEGDFILTNSMSYGRPYIMKTTGCIHDGWFVLRLNMEIDTDYFYYLLSSHFVQSQFAKLASGSVVKNISGDLVKMTVLPIPPLAHQHVIVTKLMQLSAETKQLEAIYQQKLVALDELKKSILHQAFSGQLH